MTVIGIPALETNLIWVKTKSDQFVVLDPGDDQPVLDYMNKNRCMQPVAILITHHHSDHVNGARALSQKFNIPVYAPKHHSLSWVDYISTPDTPIQLDNFCFNVLHTPGHTLDHVIYIDDAAIFTGDTLFSAGCGRLFEGTAEQMVDSLASIKLLSEHLLICPGHEYTLNNLRFAMTIEPDNALLFEHYNWAKKQRSESKLTSPLTLKKEKLINPFLRTSEQNLIQCLQKRVKVEQNDPITIFKHLRAIKDEF